MGTIETPFLKNLAKELRQETIKPIPDGLTWEQTIATHLRYGPKTEARFAFTYLYLTGQRAREALQTRRSHIQVKELDGMEVLVVDSITEKNAKQPRREIAIAMNRREKPFVEYVLSEIQGLSLDSLIMPVTRQTLWNWLSKVTVKNIRALDINAKKLVDINLRVYPHYLRHTRATHMADYYAFDHLRMMKFFGWRDTQMPNFYVQGGWEYLARGFEAQNELKVNSQNSKASFDSGLESILGSPRFADKGDEEDGLV